MRAEIQYLRFVAVTAVVLFHFWPTAFTGGYVGVDIFFVISGYLISSHLFKELSATAPFSFAKFYVRRAKRILPAALAVLLLTFVGITFISAMPEWLSQYRQVTASALFFENWELARQSVDYLAREASPSPVEHYWSLSVEEQFYLVWPLLMFLAYRLAIKKFNSKAMLAAMMTTVGVASVVYSYMITKADPAPAYFVTWGRVFEFVAGALLALFSAHADALNPLTRRVIRGLGWAAVLYSIFRFTALTPFPSYNALLPVLGTVAVIAGGTDVVRVPEFLALGQLIKKFVMYIAEISFSVYLWHWPLVIFAQAMTPHPLSNAVLLALLALTIVCAGLTTRFVENPIRFHIKPSVKPRTILLTAGVGIVSVAILASSGYFIARHSIELARNTAATNAATLVECRGAGSLDPSNNCEGLTFDSVIPDPAFAKDDVQEVVSLKCRSKVRDTKVRVCEYGKADAAESVALVGDSHAMSIFPMVKAATLKNNWKLKTYVKDGCPFVDPQFTHPTGVEEPSCATWNTTVASMLAAKRAPKYVFVTYKNRDMPMFHSDQEWIDAARSAWAPLIARGSSIVVFRDVPNVGSLTDCAVRFDASECTVPFMEHLGKDMFVHAAEGQSHVYVINLNSYICPDNTCSAVIGGVTVWRDAHHITNTYGKTLIPFFADKLRELGIMQNA